MHHLVYVDLQKFISDQMLKSVTNVLIEAPTWGCDQDEVCCSKDAERNLNWHP